MCLCVCAQLFACLKITHLGYVSSLELPPLKRLKFITDQSKAAVQKGLLWVNHAFSINLSFHSLFVLSFSFLNPTLSYISKQLKDGLPNALPSNSTDYANHVSSPMLSSVDGLTFHFLSPGATVLSKQLLLVWDITLPKRKSWTSIALSLPNPSPKVLPKPCVSQWRESVCRKGLLRFYAFL